MGLIAVFRRRFCEEAIEDCNEADIVKAIMLDPSTASYFITASNHVSGLVGKCIEFLNWRNALEYRVLGHFDMGREAMDT